MALTGKKYSSLLTAKKVNVSVYPQGGGPESVESKRPKCVRIEEAEGGFIVNKSGGSIGYNDKQLVSESIDTAMEQVKSYLGKEKKAD